MPKPPIQANEETGVRASEPYQPKWEELKRPEQQRFTGVKGPEGQDAYMMGQLEMTPAGLNRMPEESKKIYYERRGKGKAVGDFVGPQKDRPRFPQRDSTISAITGWPPKSDEQKQGEYRTDAGFSKWLADTLIGVEGFSAKEYDDDGHPAIGHGHRKVPGDPKEWFNDPEYRMSKNASYRLMLNDLTKKKAFVKGKYNSDNNNGRSDGPDSFDNLPQEMQEALTARSFHGSGYWKNMGRAINKGNLGGTLREMAVRESAWPKFANRITAERERLPGSEYFKLRDDDGKPIRLPTAYPLSPHSQGQIDDYSERPAPIPYRNE